MKRLMVLLAVLFLATVAVAEPSGLSSAKMRAVDSAVAQFMQSHKSQAVGIGIIDGGQVRYVQSYGSLSNSQPFDLASISKSLTAILALKYVEAGKLKLDAPVAHYLTEVQLPSQVTVRSLLSHTSGLPHYGKSFPSSGFSLANFTQESLVSAPGAKFNYSTPGFYLLSKVLERVDQRPFLQQINDEVALPTGAAPLTLCSGHEWKLGGGALMASPDSLTRIALALLQKKYLSPAGYQLLWTPVGATEANALGFFVEFQPTRKVSHNGSHPEDGIATRWVLYPDANQAMVILTQNKTQTNPADLSTAIYKALR